MKHDFNTKRDTLKKINKNLKKKFIGIDNIIDQITDKITSWYLFPDAQTRPMIINLWGMTGVGKTDLIRTLVKELEITDRFLEMQMSNKGVTTNLYGKPTMYNVLNRSDLEPENPNIILLDEFQRFRTVESDGSEIHDYNYQDLWALLSDGKFSTSSNMKSMLEDFIVDIMYSSDVDPSDKGDEFVEEEKPKKKKKKTNFVPMFKMSPWKARHIKDTLRLTEPLDEIMKMQEDEFLKVAKEKLEDPEFFTGMDFSKSLIFVSGNLDEAFRSAINVDDADTDADDIHNRTLDITQVDIKTALSRRFKPEQISRLGNIHIIYPSLKSSVYWGLIDLKLKEKSKFYKNRFDINIKFKQSFKDLIYRNGVFPVQGTRPLFSTVDDMVSMCVPKIIINCFEENINSVNITYNRNKNTIETGNINIPYEGPLDKIRDQRAGNKDFLTFIAFHEAGHAVSYSLLMGVTPTDIKVSTSSSSKLGYVSYHNTLVMTKEYYLKRIQSALGGIVSEQLFFGKNNTSSGGASDIHSATNTAGQMVRDFGMSDYGMHRTMDGHGTEYLSHKLEESSTYIEKLVNTAFSDVTNLLSENKDLLKDIAEYLIENKRMTLETYKEFFKKHGKDIKILSSKDSYIPEYAKMIEEC